MSLNPSSSRVKEDLGETSKKKQKEESQTTETKDKKHKDTNRHDHKSSDSKRRRSRSRSPSSKSSRKNSERSQRSSHHHHHQRRKSRSRSRSRDRSRDSKRDRRNSRSPPPEKFKGEKKHGRVRDQLRNRKLFALGLTESNSRGSSAPKATSESLAAAVMANTLLDSNQEKAVKAQLDQVKAITGVDLPKYYNPTAINPMKYAEQIKKRQMLWAPKKPEESSQQPEKLQTVTYQHYQSPPEDKDGSSFNKWEKTNFGNSQANEKFRRLMGIKGSAESDKVSEAPTVDSTKIFGQLEKEYERARTITHTQRGLGLGFSGAGAPPPNPS